MLCRGSPCRRPWLSCSCWCAACRQPDRRRRRRLPAAAVQPIDLLIVERPRRRRDGRAGARPTDIAIKDGRIAALAIWPPRQAATRDRRAWAASSRRDSSTSTRTPTTWPARPLARELRPHGRHDDRRRQLRVVGARRRRGARPDSAPRRRPSTSRRSIGHNTVRSAVMGSAEREPTPDELERMKALVFKAMADGAVGFSTGLQYVPGHVRRRATRSSSWRASAAAAGGLYATHMRNEGTALEAAVRESIDVARALDMRLQISHLKVDSPSRWGASAARPEADRRRARARPRRVEADQYAYTAGSSSLSIRFPSWALEGGDGRVRGAAERPGDVGEDQEGDGRPPRRARLHGSLVGDRRQLSAGSVAQRPVDEGRRAEARRARRRADAQIEAARHADARWRRVDGLSLHERRRHRAHHAAPDGGVRVGCRSSSSPAPACRIRAATATPRACSASTCASARSISLEEAVRKMTSLPAAHFGFRRSRRHPRGRRRRSRVFDPAARARPRDLRRAARLPEGIVHVLVNGVFVVRDGKTTTDRPGVVLRSAPKSK